MRKVTPDHGPPTRCSDSRSTAYAFTRNGAIITTSTSKAAACRASGPPCMAICPKPVGVRGSFLAHLANMRQRHEAARGQRHAGSPLHWWDMARTDPGIRVPGTVRTQSPPRSGARVPVRARAPLHFDPRLAWPGLPGRPHGHSSGPSRAPVSSAPARSLLSPSYHTLISDLSPTSSDIATSS